MSANPGTATVDAVFEGRGPWAEVEDALVCPGCQSMAERRDVAERMVRAIEAEVERARAESAEPSLPEPPLIAYAMQLRERLSRHESDLTERRVDGETTLQVAMTAAFLTGKPVGVRIGEYERLQRDLGQELGRLGDQGWSVNADHWRQDGTYRSGGGFARMLPLVLARRDGQAALARASDALADRPASEKSWLAEHAPAWDMRPLSLRIDVYDLGMGVMNGVFAVRAPTADLAATARTLKRLVWLKPDAGLLSPIAQAFRVLALETTEQFAAAVSAASPDAVQQPWLSPFLRALPDHPDGQDGRQADWGRLLWMHPVHLLEVDDLEQAAPSALGLAPPFRRPVAIADGHFVPGIGWSAIVTHSGSSGAEIPLGLIELHWAYIALYMEIDRGLLALLDDDRWERFRALQELEDEADTVFADAMRVLKARARVDSALASLGGDEQAIWDVIADVTKFDALVQGVDRKVDALQRLADRRVQQVAVVQARRTSSILSFLTALTLVTVSVTLLGSFIGSRSDAFGHIWLRVLVVLLALLAAIALYREAYRERPAIRSGARRRR